MSIWKCFYNSSLIINSACGGRDCCGSDYFQIYPVYANPKFMGCNIPRIPGYAATDSVTPTFTSCFATPAFVTKKTTAVVYQSGGAPAPTITRTVSFVATVTPVAGSSADDYINFGCYTGDNDFTGGVDAGLTGTFSVDTCVGACKGMNKEFAGIRIPASGSPVCRCGSQPPSNSPNNMESCNKICPDNDHQNCGPAAGLLVYATRGTPNNPWETSWSSTYSSTPRYSCTSMSTQYLPMRSNMVELTKSL